MLRTIDLNSDMGESFGRWQLGNDAELMEVITSANIACGWHGGDPAVMRTTVELAVAKGVGIGAHVGLPDLLGFGRRRMQVTPDEIYDYTMYQSGALRAFAEAAGGRLQHVKPHGAFYTMSAADEALAAALVRAVAALGDGVVLYGMGEIEPSLAKQAGVGYVREGYVDLNYDGGGGLVIERNKGAWDPGRSRGERCGWRPETRWEPSKGTRWRWRCNRSVSMATRRTRVRSRGGCDNVWKRPASASLLFARCRPFELY